MHDFTAATAVGTDDVVSFVAPASYAQQRLWFFDRLQPGSPLYNVQHVEFLSGALDAVALQRALDELIRRHEALRTTFRNVDGRPVQVIRSRAPAPLSLIDLTDRSGESRNRDVHRIVGEEMRRGFDLERGPLLRFTALQLEPRQQLLLFVAHHIVFDLWSVGVFTREFASLYDTFRTGQPSRLPKLQIRYAEFVASQRARFAADSQDPQLDYWRRRLKNLPRSTELPTDRPRPPVQTFKGAVRTFAVGPTVAQGFRDLTRAAHATLFMSLFAAFSVLLHRCSGQSELTVGTPIANRGKPGLGEMIGFLLNMIVLRIDLADDPTVFELLARVREMALEAFANQDVPFELLVEDLRPDRDPSRHPLFQTMFVFQPGRGGNHQPEDQEVEANGAKFDLTLTLTDAAPSFSGALEYNTDLFDPATIVRLASHFETLVAAMVAEPHRRISELDILSSAERRQIVREWNDTSTEAPPQACVHHLFEQAATAHPEAIAVTFGASSLTYGELDRQAVALAERLRGFGVGPEVRVGICMERSLDWIVAIFATLKSGGAMVPLDASFPAARLEFMMGDAGVVVVLTQSALAAKLVGRTARLICLDLPAPSDEPRGSGPAIPAVPGNLAYVVYTSGSTGRPKGVLVQHDGVANFVRAQAKAWAIGPAARVLQFTAFGFDIGLSEIFLTLCSGARLCLARQTELMPGPPLLRSLRDLRITHVTLPPSALAAMQPEALPDLGLIISAGEPCEPGLARRWAQNYPIVNAYGPTEATIYATVGAIDSATGQFPIGRPIANMQVYVLDSHGAPVPPGVTGEIHIGGIGVARGYLNRPELTAERFIEDRLSDRPGARLYRTGDLGRFDASGTLHYLGRADGQLKIRGYRIEPGEIESVLRLHPQVTDAVVLALGSGPDARLIAYVIPTDPPPLVIEMRSFLGRQLPDYMTPAAYVMVKAWPKTPNGKIDRAALPRPDSLAREVATAFVGPGNGLEQTIASIWRDCLGVAQVGITDNFFDLGGHSLLLVRVHDRLREELKTDLSLVDLFRYPTIKLLADTLKAKSAGQGQTETAALARADQRAALQNAARLQRRQRTAGDRHA